MHASSRAPRSSPKPDSAKPGREIVLLAVTGMSPAVLTETIWALAHERPPVVPDRVVAITTSAGSEPLRRLLFAPQPEFGGQPPFDALRAWLEARGHDLSRKLRCEEHILRRWNDQRRQYEPLADIRDRADSDAAADFILEQVRAFAEADDTQIIASVAGGRKTMGALLYACMTLLGRDHDRLTHVLVNEPFETGLKSPFFFPGQPLQKLPLRAGGTVRARAARIQLADVPFVPLRNLFERDLVARRSTFTALVQGCRKEAAEQARYNLALVVHRSTPRIEINGTPVTLSPKQHLLLTLLSEAETDDLTFRKLRDGLINKLQASGKEARALIPLLPRAGRCSLDLPRRAIAWGP
jgi:CRISPR-associated protein (TIGR02584 family)